MTRIEIAKKVSSLESINKLLMIDHIYGIDDPVLNHYITGIKDALIVGRKSGYKSAVKSILGINHKTQLKNLFRYGGFCESLHLDDSMVNEIYNPRKNNADIQDYISRFKRNNDIGHVYLIAGTHNGKTKFKIGKAVDIPQRLKTFEVRIPFDVELVFAIEVKNPRLVESQIHKIFGENRVSGEWFDFNSDMVVLCVLTMYSIQVANGGFSKVWRATQENKHKLDDEGYIEYLESLLVMNDVKFDQYKRKDKSIGTTT